MILATAASPLPPALHSHAQLVAEPVGALVRAAVTTSQIKRGSHYSMGMRELEAAISEFIAVHNEQPKPFVWTKSADAILNSIGRFASRTLAAHGTKNMQEITDSGD